MFHLGCLQWMLVSATLFVAGCAGEEADVAGADGTANGWNEPARANYVHDFNNVPSQIVADSIAPTRISASDLSFEAGAIYRYSSSCPSFLGCETFTAEVDEAFAAWSIPRVIAFVRSSEANASIRVWFEPSSHSDSCDSGYTHGASTLAHAFTEGCAMGGIHLNSDLSWSFAGTGLSDQGHVRYDVRTVLIHEIGHLLGLPHAQDELNVMHAAYNGAKRNVSSETLDEILYAE